MKVRAALRLRIGIKANDTVIVCYSGGECALHLANQASFQLKHHDGDKALCRPVLEDNDPVAA